MRHALRLLAALAVSLLVLGLLFHLVGGDEALSLDRLGDIARHLVVSWLAVGLAGTLAQAVVRAWRYGVLLRAGGEAVVPSRRHLLLVTMSRNMLVDLLWGRLGELSYVALLNRGFQLRVETCLSSLSLSVLFDFAALLILVCGLAAFYALTGRAAGWMAGAALVLILIIAVGLLALLRGPRLVLTLLRRLPAWRWLGALTGLLCRLEEAFALTRRAGVLGRVMGLSLLVRLSKYAGVYALFRAVTQQGFPAFALASPPQVIGALLGAEGAASVPVPSFMSFGAYEAGGAAAWTALGYPAAEAALCMLAIHVVSQVIDYSLGGASLLFLLGRRSGAAPLPLARSWKLAGVLALALLAAGFAGWQWRQVRKRGAASAPPAGHELVPAPAAPVNLPQGFIVWSSNRSGNHDIWRLRLPGLRAERITTNSHAEYYPRIAPDGRRLVFARSQRPWVSQRNVADWDVVVRDLDSGVEQVLATGATSPEWSGPDTVTYAGGGTQVVERSLLTGNVRVLCQAGSHAIPAGAQLQTPSYRAGAAVAVTLRGTLRATACVSLEGSMRAAGGGCQLGWMPGGHALLVVDDRSGRMNHSFHRIDPDTLDRRPFFDAPEPWSHEYFPRLSPDGRWLVYGACAKGHEHDTADYEVFLWEVGQPAETAVRLTWHTGNDAWPDIWLDAGP